jgi:hypothetical protein
MKVSTLKPIRGVTAIWWALALLIFLSGVAMQLGRPPRETFDLPIAVISGDRVAGGERPYVDFVALYGPVSHYATAIAIRVLRMIPPTTAALVWYALLSAINLLFLSIWMFQVSEGRPIILGCGAAALLVSGPMLVRFSYFNGLPMTLVLGTCVLAKAALDHSSLNAPRRATAAIGIAVLGALLLATKLNFGLYVCASAAGAFFVAAIGGSPFGKRLLAIYGVALATSVSAGLLALNAARMLVPLANETAAFASRAFARHLPVTTLSASSIVVFLAYLAGVMALCASAIAAAAKRNFSICYFAFLTLCFTHYLWHRVDADHVQAPVLLLTCALAAGAVSMFRSARPRFANGLLCAMVLVAVSAVPQSWGLLARRIVDRLPIRVHNSPTGAVGPAWNWVARNGVAITAEEDKMLSYLNGRMAAQDKVFWASAPDNCQSPLDDCVNLSLYLAQGKLPVGYQWIFDTPISASGEAQRTMMRTLDTARVRFVGFAKSLRPNPLLGNAPAETALYDYVRSKYAPMDIFECPPRGIVYEIYERRFD